MQNLLIIIDKQLILKNIVKILRLLNILFFIWILIRSIVFHRPTTAIPYGEPIGLFIWFLILGLLIVMERMLYKLVSRIQNEKYLRIIYHSSNIFFIILYCAFLWINIDSVYISPDVSVKFFFETGKWKW